MTIAPTSLKAYRETEQARQTRDEIVLAILRRIGRGTAFDVIRELKHELPNASDEERVRIGQGVHGSCSGLHDDGKLRRVGTEINPTTGKDVYVYEVEQIQRAPGPRNVSKRWKEKCEAAQKQVAELEGRVQWLVERNSRDRDLLAAVLRGEIGARERAQKLLDVFAQASAV